MKFTHIAKFKTLNEVFTTQGLEVDEKLRACFSKLQTAQVSNSINTLFSSGGFEINYALIGCDGAGKILLRNKVTNDPVWVTLDTLNPLEKRTIFDLAIKNQSLILAYVLLQKYATELNLGSQIITLSPSFSYFLPISTKHSCVHQYISKLQNDEFSLQIITLLCEREKPTKAQLTEAACKAFRQDKPEIARHLIRLGASPVSEILDEFFRVFDREDNADLEQACQKYAEDLLGAISASQEYIEGKLSVECDEYFPILAKHIFLELAGCFKIVMEQLDAIEDSAHEDDISVEKERQVLSELSVRLMNWLKEKLRGRKIQIKSKAVDKIFENMGTEEKYAILEMLSELNPAFHRFSLNPADKPNYYAEVPHALPIAVNASITNSDIEQAYAKLAQGARFDCQKTSSENLRKLKEELGELTPEEQNFVSQFNAFADKINLRHFTTNNLNLITNDTKALLSHDELQRRKVGHGGLTEDTDQSTGNTDFVFFAIGQGKRFSRWQSLREQPNYFLFPAKLIGLQQGWASLNDWACYKNNGAQENNVFGDICRTIIYKRSDQPFERKKTYVFSKLDSSEEFSFTVDRAEEVFFGDEVLPGLCYSIIKQLRAMQQVNSSFPKEFYETLLKEPQYIIGQAIDQFFEMEVKLPCQVSVNDCIGIYDRHGKPLPMKVAAEAGEAPTTAFAAAPQTLFHNKQPKQDKRLRSPAMAALSPTAARSPEMKREAISRAPDPRFKLM